MNPSPSILARNRSRFGSLLAFVLFALSPLHTAEALPNHPGGFLKQSELDTIRARIATGLDPWATAWDYIRLYGPMLDTYPRVSSTNGYYMQDQGTQVWQLTIKWIGSGDIRFAQRASYIIDEWVVQAPSMVVSPGNNSPGPLRTGVGAAQMANAAELLAHAFGGAAAPGGSGWAPEKIAAAKTWFKDVVYPVVATGNARSFNHGTSALVGAMSIAIFCDDQAMFDESVNSYKFGAANHPDGYCGVTQYINAIGENAESGRDQPHSQGGIGHLMEVALMAWNQNVNLVTYNNSRCTTDPQGRTYGGATGANRLFIGHEYAAKYNLGYTVPYVPYALHNSETGTDTGGIYYGEGISASGRGAFSPIWEMATHLFTLAGMDPRYSRELTQRPGYAPEGTGGDHSGLGTLLYRSGPGTPRPFVDNYTTFITYNGSWSTYYTGVDFNGSETLSRNAGNYAEWAFTGTGVQWLTRKSTNMGRADVYIDGVLSASNIDNYSATEVPQAVAYSITGLSNGPHTIRVVVKGTKSAASSNTEINIDAFQVLPFPPAVPAEPTGANVTASDTFPYNDIAVNWTPVAGATSYKILRTTDTSNNYTTIATVTGTDFLDSDPHVAGTPYYYRIVAVNAAGESYPSWEGSDVPGIIDDNSPSITYNGMISIYNNGAHKQSEHNRDVGGCFAEWTFTGTNVQWYSRKRGDGGHADVFIDGVLSAANIDLYQDYYTGIPLDRKVKYSIAGLSNGQHTIKVLVKGSKNPSSGNSYVVMDAFGVGTAPVYSTATFVRSIGGTGTASAQASAGEGAGKAFDVNVGSKWFTAGVASFPQWVQYEFAPGISWAIDSYKVTSANDVPARDPKDWQFQGSNDGVHWITLDTRTGETFANRYLVKTYPVSNVNAYSRYRLLVTANNGSLGDGVQLAEFELDTITAFAPMITTPATITVPSTGPSGAVVTFTTSALDSFGASVATTNDIASGSVFPIGTTTVTTSATDLAGNSVNRTFLVIVEPPPPSALWNGAGADNNWLTPENWTVLPVPGEALIFAGNTRLASVNNFTANTLFGGISFNSGSGAFVLGGNAINLGGPINNNSTALETINLAMRLTTPDTVITTASGNVTIGGIISDGANSYGITKAGPQILTLGAANTYDGGTTINGGKLLVTSNNVTIAPFALGTGVVGVNAGGTLEFAPGSTTTVFNHAQSFAFNGGTFLSNDGRQHLGTGPGATVAIQSGGAVFNILWGGKDLYIDGQLTGSGPITVRDTNGGNQYSGGAVHFTNATNTYGGTLTIEPRGYIQIDSNNALASATIINNSTGNTGGNAVTAVGGFLPGAAAPVIGALGGNGSISGTATLTLGGNGASTTYSGVLGHTGGLVKNGGGTMTLSNANTYAGGTTLNGGAILITNTTGSALGTGAVSVQSAATLGGTGTITGAATVSTGGILAPGLGGTGTLNLGALTLNGGAMNMELGAPASSDKVVLTGNFAATGTTVIQLAQVAGFTLGTYPLITGATGINAANFSLAGVPAGYTGNLAVSGNTLNLVVTDITPPVITVPPNITTSNPIVTYTVTALDAISGSVVPICTPASGSTFPVGTTTVQCIATDPSGNQANASFTVTVTSSAPPAPPTITMTNGNAQIITPSEAGKTYQLQRSYTLALGSWQNVGAAQAGGGTLNFADTPDPLEKKAFYRILIGP